MGACHGSEFRSTFQTHRRVAELREDFQVAAGTTAKIQDPERRLSFEILQKRGDVLRDIMVARALPKVFRLAVVMFERHTSDFVQVLWVQFHDGVWPMRACVLDATPSNSTRRFGVWCVGPGTPGLCAFQATQSDKARLCACGDSPSQPNMAVLRARDRKSGVQGKEIGSGVRRNV